MEKETYIRIIEPKKGWVSIDFKELWHYRDLLYFLVWRDIKVRYSETVLGIAWAVIQPLTTVLVFSVIFGRWIKVSSEGYPYALFVYAAVLPWGFFSTAVTTCGNSVLGSANLITKVYFPRLVIPIASIGAGIIDFLISLCVMFLLMFFYRVPWHPGLLLLPFLFLCLAFTALGIGTLVSALIVSYRDLRHVLPFAIQIWMYLTPIVYSPSLFSQKWRWVLNFNPMAGLIENFRSAFLGKPFDIAAFGISLSVAALFFLIGVSYFEQVQRKFADIL